MQSIIRQTSSSRWADVVIFRDEARWVEVAEETSVDAANQIGQILKQIDAMLLKLGSSNARLLEVMIYLANLDDVPALNVAWDAWVDTANPPIRACVQAGLQKQILAEFVIRAAV